MFSEDFESFVTNLIFLLQLRVVSDSGKLLLRRRRRQHWAELRLRLQRSWMFRSSGSSRTRLHARTYRDTHTHTLFSLTCTDTCTHAQQTHLQASMHTLTQYLSFLSHLHWHNIESMRHTHTQSVTLSLCLFLSWKHLIFSSHLFPKVARSLPPILASWL